jgi:prevent-host-death family protein
MRSVNVGEAKTHLSSLIESAERGEEVVIAKAGRPVVRLVPIRGSERVFGIDRGRFTVPDDFDAPLPDDVLAGFSGEPRPRPKRASTKIASKGKRAKK